MSSSLRPSLQFMLPVSCFSSWRFFLVRARERKAIRWSKLAPPRPQELSAAVRAVLGDQELRVSGLGGLICEIWLRKTVPAKAPGQDLGRRLSPAR